jgi:hypothetical protein
MTRHGGTPTAVSGCAVRELCPERGLAPPSEIRFLGRRAIVDYRDAPKNGTGGNGLAKCNVAS